jgi:hypothetical protein
MLILAIDDYCIGEDQELQQQISAIVMSRRKRPNPAKRGQQGRSAGCLRQEPFIAPGTYVVSYPDIWAFDDRSEWLQSASN